MALLENDSGKLNVSEIGLTYEEINMFDCIVKVKKIRKGNIYDLELIGKNRIETCKLWGLHTPDSVELENFLKEEMVGKHFYAIGYPTTRDEHCSYYCDIYLKQGKELRDLLIENGYVNTDF